MKIVSYHPGRLIWLISQISVQHNMEGFVVYGHIFVVIIMRFIVMNNGNGPPARIQFQKSVDGKLNSHLEWPNETWNKARKFL